MENLEKEQSGEGNSQAKELGNIGKYFRAVFDKNGWKKDWKKIGLISLIVLLGMAGSLITKKDLLGLRVIFDVERIKYQKYSHIGPDFSFQYPDYYVFDGDEEKKFGNDYLAGFRLRTDRRTGCDVRTSAAGLNFKKNDEEIKKALVNDLSRTAKNFSLINSGRTTIGGNEAFSLEFTFVDPLGNNLRLFQTMTTNKGGHYLLVCGTGDYQYRFFARDFEKFLETFKWQSKAI